MTASEVGLSREQALRHIRHAVPDALTGAVNDRAVQVGGLSGIVSRVLVAQFPSAIAIAGACRQPDTLLVTAAALIWPPVWTVFSDPRRTCRINDLLQARSALLVLSHRWRCSSASEALAKQLELDEIQPLVPAPGAPLVKLVIFVPEEHVDRVRMAASHAGAGNIGNYSECSFASTGSGTFKPGTGAHPSVGSVGTLEHVAEVRLEMTAAACDVEEIMEAVRRVHPYEEVAYDAFLLDNRGSQRGTGRIGRLSTPMTVAELVDRINGALGLTGVTSARGSRAEAGTTECLAVTAGRANEAVILAAAGRGAGAVVCGGLSAHSDLLAEAAGVSLIDVGLRAAAEPGLASLVSKSAGLFGPAGVEVARVG